MFNIIVSYPTVDEEEKILSATTIGESPEIKKILSGKAIVNLQKLVHSVQVTEHFVKYVARLVRATRPSDPSAPKTVKECVDWGAGPRAGQFLIAGAKAIAAMDGRFTISAADIRRVALPVLRHRIGVNFQGQANGVTSEQIVALVLKEIPEPDIPKFEGAGNVR